MTSLQEMPDDILEVIYKNLNIHDAINANKALHRKIKVAKLSCIYSKKSFNKIPRYFRRYMNIYYNVKQKDIDDYLYTDVNSVICDMPELVELDCKDTLSLRTLTNLPKLDKLECDRSGVIDIDHLTSLSELSCRVTNITKIDSLVNLVYLYCCNSKISDLSNQHKLKF
jgi:hypothetical protein